MQDMNSSKDNDDHNNNLCLTLPGRKIINFVALSTLACITVQFVESTGAEKKDLSAASQTLLNQQ